MVVDAKGTKFYIPTMVGFCHGGNMPASRRHHRHHHHHHLQLDLVHLGAKYGPCMRWDETIDRQIQNERNKVSWARQNTDGRK